MKQLPAWVWAIVGLSVIAALGVGVLIGRATNDGSDAASEAGQDTQDDGEETTDSTTTLPPDDDAQPDGEAAEPQRVRVYFARGEHLGVISREVPATKAIATAAVEQLLLGPSSEEQGWGFSTAVPVGTSLLGLTIENGFARVDLSGEFAEGGGTLSATMRLAQVVFTLTQFPTVERVDLYMDGERVDLFMGEGIILEKPQDRGMFEDVLPALFVESPLPGDMVTSPIEITGTGNTFEAAFMVKLEGADGSTIVEKPAMATSGTGTRGTFDLELTYPDAARGAATLIVYEASAKDGSPINVVEIPVTLGP